MFEKMNSELFLTVVFTEPVVGMLNASKLFGFELLNKVFFRSTSFKFGWFSWLYNSNSRWFVCLDVMSVCDVGGLKDVEKDFVDVLPD